MRRYAAVMLALAFVAASCGKVIRGISDYFEESEEAPDLDYVKRRGVWGDAKVEPRYGYGEPVADWPAVEYVYAGEWGTRGSGKGEFLTPTHIAVAPDGTVYVSDGGGSGNNCRIQYFDPSGTYLGQWEVNFPMDVAVAPNGDVYVNEWGEAIKRFTRTGSLLAERAINHTEFIENGYNGLAVASNGNVYVSCHYADRIKYYTPGGKLLGGWGLEGAGDGEFQSPITVAVAPNGCVYVNDRRNKRIQYFTPNGSFLGQKRFCYKPFNAPVDAAAAPNGHLYVADAGNYRVVHLDADGEVVATWGRQGSGDGEFRAMSAVAVGPKGDVYVGDYCGYIQRFTAAGSFVGRWGTRGKKPGQFEGPASIAVDPGGVVYVADAGNHRIQYFTADGSFLGAWDRSGWRLGPLRIPGPRLDMPASVAVGPNGNIYVLEEWSKRVYYFTATGTFLGKWGTEKGWLRRLFLRSWKGDLAVAPNGYVYVGNNYRDRVQYYTSSGSLLGKWRPVTGTGEAPDKFEERYMTGLAVGPGGNVFITDGIFNRVRCFTPAGSFRGDKGESPAKDAAGGDIADLAVGPEGDIYVCHVDDEIVARYSPSGEVLAAWGGSSWIAGGPKPGLFESPIAIAVAADGTVYVADYHNDRVQYFRPVAPTPPAD